MNANDALCTYMEGQGQCIYTRSYAKTELHYFSISCRFAVAVCWPGTYFIVIIVLYFNLAYSLYAMRSVMAH